MHTRDFARVDSVSVLPTPTAQPALAGTLKPGLVQLSLLRGPRQPLHRLKADEDSRLDGGCTERGEEIATLSETDMTPVLKRQVTIPRRSPWVFLFHKTETINTDKHRETGIHHFLAV